jgi:hypothetical protein
MTPVSDDELIDDFFASIKRDGQAKQQLAAALRMKDKLGLRQAAVWVVDNIIKPTAIAVRDRFIPAIVDWLKSSFLY